MMDRHEHHQVAPAKEVKFNEENIRAAAQSALPRELNEGNI